MANIGLGQQSYLLNLLIKILPDQNTETLWGLTEVITEKQYRFFIALYFHDRERLKKEVETLILKKLNNEHSDQKSGEV